MNIKKIFLTIALGGLACSQPGLNAFPGWDTIQRHPFTTATTLIMPILLSLPLTNKEALPKEFRLNRANAIPPILIITLMFSTIAYTVENSLQKMALEHNQSENTRLINNAAAGLLNYVQNNWSKPSITAETKKIALEEAARKGKFDTVKWICEQQGITAESKIAALGNAAANGYLPVVRYLWTQDGITENAKQESLNLAKMTNKRNVVQWIEHPDQPVQEENQHNQQQINPNQQQNQNNNQQKNTQQELQELLQEILQQQNNKQQQKLVENL